MSKHPVHACIHPVVNDGPEKKGAFHSQKQQWISAAWNWQHIVPLLTVYRTEGFSLQELSVLHYTMQIWAQGRWWKKFIKFTQEIQFIVLRGKKWQILFDPHHKINVFIMSIKPDPCPSLTLCMDEIYIWWYSGLPYSGHLGTSLNGHNNRWFLYLVVLLD